MEGKVTDTLVEAQVLDAVVTVDSLLDDFDVVDLLTDLTSRAAALLDVSAAGLLLADPLEQLRLLAATSEQPGPELFQLQAEEARASTASSGQPVSVAGTCTSRFGGGQQFVRRPRRRVRLGARCSDARRRHRPRCPRPVRNPSRRTESVRSSSARPWPTSRAWQFRRSTRPHWTP